MILPRLSIQENQRITPTETHNLEAKSNCGRTIDHAISDGHSRHSGRYQEHKDPKKRKKRNSGNKV